MADPNSKVAVAIEDELRGAYLEYAMSVIIGRAIPDVRDGLKPVHRRILYAMHEMKLTWNQSYRKSARVVGDVLGKYHPHGDSAVYDALVRMAQPFAMRYPLIDGQGNFGSVDGDSPAAMRYTESRMARLASELLADIDKETVDFGPNFDESEREPLVLPSRFPNLLVNGSAGIAVGMATNVAPHNLREVIDATVRLIRNPELTIDELMLDEPESGEEAAPGEPPRIRRIGLKGPDFPTAGFVQGIAGIRQAFQTGRGRIVMRARTMFEAIPGRSDREQIVITELPYQVNKAELVKKIAQLAREKRIEGIGDLRDESDRDGMRVVIEIKRDAEPQIVLNQLFQMTPLQSSFGVNNLAIVGNRPRLLTLKETLNYFIEHRREVVTRRTRFELREAEAQRELVEGLGMAITETDLVIKTIRAARDSDQAKQDLMQLELRGLEAFVRRAGRPQEEIDAAKARGAYFLSERQAKAILEMRLSRLTGLEQEKLAAEYGELCDTIVRLKRILASEVELMNVIVTELDDIRARYGDDRRTEIVADEGDIRIEDLVSNEDVVVTVSHAGYIKRVPASEYRAQGRGGRGKRAMETRDEDFVEQIFVANNHDHILYLSDKGIAYLKKVYEIPEASRTSKGRAVVNFVGMDAGDRVAAIVPIKEFVEGDHLLTCTRGGTVKRTSLSAYSNIRSTGIIGVGLAPDDALLTAKVVREGQDVIIGTANGMSIRFNVSDVRPMGRDARGVRGIELREGDRVIGMDVIQSDEHQVLTVSENGYGKRTPVGDWRVQGRGGIGIIAMETSERNGSVVNLCLVVPSEQFMCITNAGQVIRTEVAQVREVGRNTQGVRVMSLGENERVVDVAKLAERDEEGRNSRAPAAGGSEPPPGDGGGGGAGGDTQG
ncbi:MAG TPA: DNA gyrase subunit A [Polyangiales bacterium]|nr:DNA gyrase subunit A [Polyangiales bacterium]